MDEEIPHLDRFDYEDAWLTGTSLMARARADELAVTISIWLGEQRVFHAARPGTSADNDAWAERKAAVVRRFGASSQAVGHRYVTDDVGAFFAAFGLPPTKYSPAGGAIPVFVGDALVGVVAVSGLDSAADHDLAVATLREFADTSLREPAPGRGTP